MMGRQSPQPKAFSGAVRLGKTEVGVHIGNVLMDHLAARYPNLMLTLIEGIQNAIDAEAKKVVVFVDQRARTVFMLDNGSGINVDRFNRAIRTIGQTVKAAGKLGRYGIGVISPVNKCERYYIISKTGRATYTYWPFVAQHIRAATTSLSIEPVQLDPPKLPQLLTQGMQEYMSPNAWRTMLVMERITQDKVTALVDMDDLEEKILSALGPAMSQKGVTCRVVIVDENDKVQQRDIKPRNFTGPLLGIFELSGNDVGNVTITLHQAPLLSQKRRREGGVGVSEAAVIYPVAWENVSRQVMSSTWYKEYAEELQLVLDAFSSGFFEGLILADNITLLPERNKFEFDDPFVDLLMVLAYWYGQEGHKFYNQEKVEERDQHQRRLVLEVLNEVNTWAQGDQQWRGLMEAMRDAVQVGRVGEGHTGDLKPVGRDEKTSTRSGRGGAGVERSSKEAGRQPTQHRPAHGPYDEIPTGVMGGTSPQRRTRVRQDSTGLWIDVVDFTYGTELFHFDLSQGLLEFNSGNQVWSELYGASEKRRTTKYDRWIKKLMKWVILEVLAHSHLPEDQFAVVCETLNKRAPLFADALIKDK